MGVVSALRQHPLFDDFEGLAVHGVPNNAVYPPNVGFRETHAPERNRLPFEIGRSLDPESVVVGEVALHWGAVRLARRGSRHAAHITQVGMGRLYS